MKYKKNIIFGCGYYGRAIFRKIKKKDIIFIDNDPLIKKCLGQKVFKPYEVIKRNISYEKIFLAGRYLDEQVTQLKKLNLSKKIKIFKNFELLPSKKILMEREKKILLILKLIFNKFNKCKINYWIDRSSLLAIFRNQLLSELSDVDISIDIKDYEKISKILKELKKKINVRYKKINLKKKKIKKFYITSSKKNIKNQEPALIDFIYRKINKKKISSLGIILKDVPSRFLEERKKYIYKDVKFFIPKNTKMYLRFIYGPNWKKKAKFYLKSNRI